jgi:hypothetical protein
VMEEALNGFIEASLFNPEQLKLARTNFHLKGDFAVSLAANRGKDEMWAVFWAINQLRNEIAHNLDSKKIDEKMSFLRKTYSDALEPNPAAYAKTQTDKDLVDSACLRWLPWATDFGSKDPARDNRSALERPVGPTYASDQKLNSSSRANVFCSSLNNGHQDHSLVPIGRLVALDHRSGRFVLKKLEFLRANEAHRSAPSPRQRFDHPPTMGERTHSLMVIGASGQNQISMLARQCLL